MAEVRIYGWKAGANSIGAIKLVKDYAKLGLKDAKTLVENAMGGTKTTDINGNEFYTNGNPQKVDVPFLKRTEFMIAMKEKGFLVS